MTMAQFQKLNPGLIEYGTGNWKVLFPGQIVNVNGVVTGQPPETVASAPTSFAAPPPWMQIAIMEQGVQEWSQGDNPRIIEYLKSCGLPQNLLHDETAWCAAFVNWCIRKSGFRGHNTGLAGQWISYGRAVAPTYGCVVVTKPLSAGASGHIGFLHALDGSNVWLLSGNSANRVRISAYKRSSLAAGQCFRWPV